jgi:hypothetical protein
VAAAKAAASPGAHTRLEQSNQHGMQLYCGTHMAQAAMPARQAPLRVPPAAAAPAWAWKGGPIAGRPAFLSARRAAASCCWNTGPAPQAAQPQRTATHRHRRHRASRRFSGRSRPQGGAGASLSGRGGNATLWLPRTHVPVDPQTSHRPASNGPALLRWLEHFTPCAALPLCGAHTTPRRATAAASCCWTTGPGACPPGGAAAAHGDPPAQAPPCLASRLEALE